MSMGAAIALGAAAGFGLGIAVSLLTSVPFAPEVGLAVGVVVAWFWRANTGER